MVIENYIRINLHTQIISTKTLFISKCCYLRLFCNPIDHVDVTDYANGCFPFVKSEYLNICSEEIFND